LLKTWGSFQRVAHRKLRYTKFEKSGGEWVPVWVGFGTFFTR